MQIFSRLIKSFSGLLPTLHKSKTDNFKIQVYLLIFFSGFSSLIYEIVWIRQASFVFGSSAFALSTVLAVFFLGLGLGNLLFGRLSFYIQQPLLWCAAVECLLACYGLASHTVFNAADTVYGHIYKSFNINSGQLLAIRAGLVSLILLPPCLVMGGTLPLFCKQQIQEPSKISAKLSYIYGFNTLGAALGCIASGFLFLPRFGLSSSLIIAAIINFIVGLGFWHLNTLLKRTPEIIGSASRSNQAYSDSAKGANESAVFLAGILLFIIGAVALANELLWARFLTHFIRNSVYTYSLALSVVLIGMGLGSLWLGPKFDRIENSQGLLIRFAALQIASAIIVQVLTHLPAGFWQSINTLGMMPFVFLMLPSAILAGASFPLVNRLAIQQSDNAATTIGTMTSLNILGCVFGSLLTGYWLLPHFGLHISIVIATGFSICAAMLALWLGVDIFKIKGKSDSMALVAIHAGVIVWTMLVIFPLQRIPQDLIARDDVLIDMMEGYNSNLAVVTRSQEKTLLVDHLWQGVGSRNYQVMVAHIPMLHYPEAKSVLVVGLGAGNTASRFLYYGIEHLDIVDIEPRLFEFTRKHFPSAWMDDPRVQMLPEDGRNYIKHSEQKYDLISVEIGQLDRPGVGVFYTREFYRQAHQRLHENGMITQFVPLAFLSPNEFASIIKTFLMEFPHAQLWYNTDELLLMGFKGEIKRISAKQFAEVTAKPIIKSDININYWGGSLYSLNRFSAFISGFFASGQELIALSKIAPAEVYTDDKLQISYSISSFQRKDQRALMLEPFLEKNLTSMDAALEHGFTDERTLQAATEIRAINVADIAASDILGMLDLAPPGQPPSAKSVYQHAQQALLWNPRNVIAQAKSQSALLELTKTQQLDESWLQ